MLGWISNRVNSMIENSTIDPLCAFGERKQSRATLVRGEASGSTNALHRFFIVALAIFTWICGHRFVFFFHSLLLCFVPPLFGTCQWARLARFRLYSIFILPVAKNRIVSIRSLISNNCCLKSNARFSSAQFLCFDLRMNGVRMVLFVFFCVWIIQKAGNVFPDALHSLPVVQSAFDFFSVSSVWWRKLFYWNGRYREEIWRSVLRNARVTDNSALTPR